MLSFNAILDAVVDLLNERFPADKIYTNLVRKGFSRPSFLVELEKIEMEDASAATLELSVPVKVTVFTEVDECHDSHMEGLVRRMAAVQELFAVEGLRVNDRVLHVGMVEGECNYDYAEVTVPLHYLDDRPGGREWPLMGEIGARVETR